MSSCGHGPKSESSMPDYSLSWTARSSAIQWWQRCLWCSSLTRRYASRSWEPYALKSPFVGQCFSSVKANSKLILSASTPEQGFSSFLFFISLFIGRVEFDGISTTVGYLQPHLLCTHPIWFANEYIKYKIWFGRVLWHINHCRLFDAKSCFYIFIKYIWFSFVWFYGISIIVGYLVPNPVFTYILNIYDLVWFGLVWFYGISTIEGYLTLNPVFTYILNIYDLV